MHFAVPRCLNLALITSLSATLLSACGGGGDAASPAAAATEAELPTGPLGKAAALTSGYLRAGTYSVANCTLQDTSAGTSNSVNIKLRLLANGQIDVLDGNANEQVLTSYVPQPVDTTGNATRSDQRYIELDFDANSPLWNFQYGNGHIDTVSQSVVNDMYIEALPTSVAVRWDLDSNNNFTKSLNCSNGNSEVVTIPLALSDTVLRAKLASVGALGANGQGVSFNQTQTVMAITYDAGSLSSGGDLSTTESGQSPFSWGIWGDSAVANRPSKARLIESWYADTVNGNGAGGKKPGMPEVKLTIQHPTGTATGGQPYQMMFAVKGYSHGLADVPTMGQ